LRGGTTNKRLGTEGGKAAQKKGIIIFKHLEGFKADNSCEIGLFMDSYQKILNEFNALKVVSFIFS